MFVIIEQNQTTVGDIMLNCSARSNDGNDSDTSTTSIRGLAVEAYQLISRNINNKIATFNLYNYFHAVNATWNTSTGEQQFANRSANLSTNAFVMVFEEFNYTNDSQKNISISAGAPQLNDSSHDRTILEALKITRKGRYDDNSSTQVLWFDINNQWTLNLSVAWNVSTPNMARNDTIAQNRSLMVFVQNAYDAGVQEPVFASRSGAYADSESSAFSIVPVDVQQYQVMRQQQNSTIAEFVVRNNDNATNVSWRMLTGATTITATSPVSLNRSASVFVITETNYTSTGVYTTTGIANSTTNADNGTGVAVV